MKNSIVDSLKNLNKKRALIGLIVILAVVIIDQLSKFWAGLAVKVGENLYVTLFLDIVNIKNDGVSFGMFQGFEYSNICFIFLTLSILLVVFAFLIREKLFFNFFGLCLIMGGAIGNLIDRVFYSAVRDFFDFHFFSFNWPAFNFADAAICVGVMMYLFLHYCFGKDGLNA